MKKLIEIQGDAALVADLVLMAQSGRTVFVYFRGAMESPVRYTYANAQEADAVLSVTKAAWRAALGEV